MLDQEPETTQREQDLAREILSSVVQQINDGGALGATAVGNVSKALARYRAELGEVAKLSVCADLDLLSPREREVARWLQAGLRPTAIAQRLHVSHHTVRNHLKHTFRKLGVGSQIELLALLRGGRNANG